MAERKNRVLVTRAVPGEIAIEGPSGAAQVDVLGEGAPERADLLRAVRGADVLVSMFSDRVDEELLDAAGDTLRGVCNFAVGFNNIDVEACRKRGISVTNTPDAVTEGTANIAWALLLAVSRRVVEGDRFARSGKWAETGTLGMADFLGVHLTGQTMLIVGAGRIGFAVATRAHAFGMRVLYVARSRHWGFELAPIGAERVSLEEGLTRADVVSVHTPLTPETRHLIGDREIGFMKSNAIIINTSRGPVIDEAALADALREKRIWGAGLDVFEEEPRVHQGLVDLGNVTMTPHIGSAERHYREEMTRMVCENAGAILRGERPPNLVG